jgi:hypothetical protein
LLVNAPERVEVGGAGIAQGEIHRSILVGRQGVCRSGQGSGSD